MCWGRSSSPAALPFCGSPVYPSVPWSRGSGRQTWRPECRDCTGVGDLPQASTIVTPELARHTWPLAVGCRQKGVNYHLALGGHPAPQPTASLSPGSCTFPASCGMPRPGQLSPPGEGSTPALPPALTLPCCSAPDSCVLACPGCLAPGDSCAPGRADAPLGPCSVPVPPPPWGLFAPC